MHHPAAHQHLRSLFILTDTPGCLESAQIIRSPNIQLFCFKAGHLDADGICVASANRILVVCMLTGKWLHRYKASFLPCLPFGPQHAE
jgi:hypothetical protein